MAKFFDVFWPAIIGAMAIVIGALIAGSLSRRIKISEFRQAWINDLRRDIADYMVAARKWHLLYEQAKNLGSTEDRDISEREKLLQASNEALVILWRIKLRFNPNENKHKKEDEDFVKKLSDLLDPGKLRPPQPSFSWDGLASETIEKARSILKREWEVTKDLWPTFALPRYSVEHDLSTMSDSELTKRFASVAQNSSDGALFRFAVAFGFSSMIISLLVHSTVNPLVVFLAGVATFMLFGIAASFWLSHEKGD